MTTTGSLNHIDISVGYPDRSIPFYHAFFTALGYKRWQLEGEWGGERPQRATWSIKLGADLIFGVEVRPAHVDRRDRRYDRYEPGPHHLAFNAESPEVVRRVHAAMVAVDATVLDPPTDYTGKRGYSDGYYAVFFADPDDLKLEVACIVRGTP
jgi:catechol 2,3-dioxygenase-like lactoylglutathione lyase family enzyme